MVGKFGQIEWGTEEGDNGLEKEISVDKKWHPYLWIICHQRISIYSLCVLDYIQENAWKGFRLEFMVFKWPKEGKTQESKDFNACIILFLMKQQLKWRDVMKDGC